MPLFPLPALLALAGWLFIFFTSETPALIYGVASLVAGVAAFLVWDRIVNQRSDGRTTGDRDHDGASEMRLSLLPCFRAGLRVISSRHYNFSTRLGGREALPRSFLRIRCRWIRV